MGKIESYLGFALRARKLTLGVNAVKALHSAFLLVADNEASENTKEEIRRLAARFSCPTVWVDDLEGMTGKAYCKLAAVLDEHLAAAVLGAKEQSNNTVETEGL